MTNMSDEDPISVTKAMAALTDSVTALSGRVDLVTERIVHMTSITDVQRKSLEKDAKRTDDTVSKISTELSKVWDRVLDNERRLDKLENASGASIDDIAARVSTQLTKRDVEAAQRTKWGQIVTAALAIGAAIAQALGHAS